MAEELDNVISDNAQGPKRVQGDEATIEGHSLPDQIAADRYLASKKAASNNSLGLRFRKIVPPGTA